MHSNSLDLTPELIRERLRWARRQGHPFHLWPDMSVGEWRASLREIHRVTTHVLAGDSTTVPELSIPADTRKMGVAAFTSGMGALLGYWIEAGKLAAPPGVSDLLSLHLRHGRERARLLTDELGKAVELLVAVGIDPIVIKGAHTAHVYFPDPGTRPASDLDLVIGLDEVGEASRVLREGGYVETHRQSRPRKSDWVPPGASTTIRSLEVTHRDNPVTIDLHTTLDRNFFGRGIVSLGPVDGSSTRRHLLEISGGRPGGVGVRILQQPLLAASLAAHASEKLHNLSMIRLVELVLVLRRDLAQGELVWADLCSMLERADAMRFVYPAFEMAERLVPGTLEPVFHARLAEAAPPRMRRVLADVQPFNAHRFEVLALDERFMWARGLVEHVRGVVQLLWPSSVGGSLRVLFRMYANRLRRVVRGRISIRTLDFGLAPTQSEDQCQGTREPHSTREPEE